MVHLNTLKNKISSYLKENYTIENIDYIPTVSNLSHGNRGKILDLCVFSIDLRGSTKMLKELGREKAGRIHKAFLYVAAEMVKDRGGKIRNYTGDGLLAFWIGNDNNKVSNAVRTAMHIKYLLKGNESPIKAMFDQNTILDFGIGVDVGEIYVFRAGVSTSHYDDSDLIFMGDCVNFAVLLSSKAGSPTNIEISELTYNMLNNDLVYNTRNEGKINMWTSNEIEGKENIKHKTKRTTWYWRVN